MKQPESRRAAPAADAAKAAGARTGPVTRAPQAAATRTILSSLGNQAAQRLIGEAPERAGPSGVDSPDPLASTLGPAAGTPLPSALQRSAETSTGQSLADIRLDHGTKAAEATARNGAEALTVGRNIFIRPERWAPDTESGRTLLGHELIHAAQNATFGRGTARSLSERGDSAEREAERLAPRVLEGKSGAARPFSAPRAMIGRQQSGGDTASTMPAPPFPTGPTSTPDSDPEGTAGATLDPALINVRALTNADLIMRGVEASQFLAKATTTSLETEAWRQLQREIRDERTRRVGLGFIFLAEQTDTTPAALYQMRGGAAPGTIEIVTVDGAAAMGSADVTLTGGILSQNQIRAYIATLGYRTITGPQAEGLIANRGDIIRSAIEAERLRSAGLPVQSGIGRTSFFDYRLAGGFRAYGPSSGPDRLPIQLGDVNFRGRVGEIGMGSDWRTGWGIGLRDYNTLPWVDVTGRTQTGNFPVVDFGPGRGAVPRILDIQPISVTTSGAKDYATRRQQYIMKIEALLDVAGRRATAPAGTDLVLQHLRQAGGNATLTAGTPAYQQAMARYLPDTMFAVPDADVAALRTAIAHPNAAPPGGTNRLIARGGGFGDLYAEALRSSPIQLTLRDGSRITCSSLAELAARTPVASRFSVAGSTISYPPDQRISTVEYSRAMDVLGQTAASRIVPIGSAPAIAATADTARAPGAGAGPVITTPTRILEVDSRDLGYIGERIGQGMADPRRPGAPGSGGMRWTTAAETDPALSAVRAMTNNLNLQRGTPEFEAARRQALGNAVVAINADDVADFQRTLTSEATWDSRLRESFAAAMADNPVEVVDTSGNRRSFRSPTELDAARASMTPEQYNMARAQAQALVAGRVIGSGLTTAQLNRLEGFRDTAIARLGEPGARSVLQPDVLSHVRLGSTRATAEAAGRGGLGGMIIGVVTTAGTMYIDEREHPDWAIELAEAGGRDFALSGSQSGIESRLTYYAAQRALATGTPLSGLTRLGLRAGVAAPFAGLIETYNMQKEQREHSTTEGVTRVGRAMGIAIISMEAGAFAGSIVPGAGTAAGAVVGFLVGAIAGGLVAYFLESHIPGGAKDWNAAAASEEETRRWRAAEAQRQAMPPRVVDSFGQATTLMPVMSSPDITTEEQAAIAQWATLLTIARRTPPSGEPPIAR